MKKTIFSVVLFALMLTINLMGCKTDKLVQPTAKSSQQEQLSADPLINYLSKTSNVSISNISFDNSLNSYVIKNAVKISKQRLELSYKNANEYKIRNGISITK